MDNAKQFAYYPVAVLAGLERVDHADFKCWLDGELALEYALGSAPAPGRGGAAPNTDLFPENNPVLRPPVDGRVGLWAKTASTSYFKDYVVSPR